MSVTNLCKCPPDCPIHPLHLIHASPSMLSALKQAEWRFLDLSKKFPGVVATSPAFHSVREAIAKAEGKAKP